MLHEIEHHALHCLDRETLEGLQIHARYLRDRINRHARTLPLRYIHLVYNSGEEVVIQLREDDRWNEVSRIGTTDERDLETLFHRVNNAFIHRFTTGLRQAAAPFLSYLRGRACDLNCRIRTLTVSDNPDAIDYALVDFLAIELKPRIYNAYESSAISPMLHLALVKRNALRTSIQHFVYETYGNSADGHVLDTIIPEPSDVDVIESCAIKSRVDPRPWIRKYVEKFETAERGVHILRSVALFHEGYAISRWRPTVDPLGLPGRIAVPSPHNAFIKEWSRRGDWQWYATNTESTVAERFVFENAKLAKKLEIFAWTVEHVRDFRNPPLPVYYALHYAYLLNIVDV